MLTVVTEMRIYMKISVLNFKFSLEWLISVGLLLLKAAIILLLGHYIIVFLLKLIKKSFKKVNMDFSLERFLTKTINISLHIIIILSALNALGISTTGLLAAISAAGVAVALALKDSLSSIAGGILLLVNPRFATGDFIEVNGDKGTVLEIDLMHTTLKAVDNRHIVVPNGVIINNQVINYSSEDKRRLDMVFSVGYNDDIKLAEKTILEVIETHKSALCEPEKPFVRVGDYADSSVDITVRVWCNAEDYWALRFDLLEQVRAEFDKKGITIPFKQLDVHITNN